MLSLSAQGCDMRFMMRGVWRPLESSYATGPTALRAYVAWLLRTQKNNGILVCAYDIHTVTFLYTLPYKVTLGLASTLDVDRRPTLVPLVWSGHWLCGTLLTTA